VFDKEARKAGISLTTETRRTQCLIRRPGRQELEYGLGVGLAILQFRVGGNGVKSSGPSVRLVHF
jgi:hypothetical protein